MGCSIHLNLSGPSWLAASSAILDPNQVILSHNRRIALTRIKLSNLQKNVAECSLVVDMLSLIGSKCPKQAANRLDW